MLQFRLAAGTNDRKVARVTRRCSGRDVRKLPFWDTASKNTRLLVEKRKKGGKKVRVQRKGRRNKGENEARRGAKRK